MDPNDLKFSKTHEWVAVGEEGGEPVATVGISAFAVEALNDLVYIELPEAGREVKAGDSFCEVESVKAVSDIYAPIGGSVIAVNEDLPDALEKISTDPYGEGWIAKIRIADPDEITNLMDRAAYEKQCAEES